MIPVLEKPLDFHRGYVDAARLGPRRDVVFGPAECEPTAEQIAEHVQRIRELAKEKPMTIRIGIKNLDSRESAVVAVKVQTPDGQPVSGNPDTELKGGEETDKYVHSGQRLVVEEVKNG